MQTLPALLQTRHIARISLKRIQPPFVFARNSSIAQILVQASNAVFHIRFKQLVGIILQNTHLLPFRWWSKVDVIGDELNGD